MDKIEKAVIGIGAIMIIGSIVAVYYMGVIYHQKANGHPEEECGKNPHSEKKAPHAFFLSKPQMVVPAKPKKAYIEEVKKSYIKDIKLFQKESYLNVDGVCGRLTCLACIKEEKKCKTNKYTMKELLKK